MSGISPKFPSLGVIAIRALIFSETERRLVPGAKLVPCVCIAADHIRGQSPPLSVESHLFKGREFAASSV